MFDLYNTLESYGIIDNDYAYEGIIDKVKNAGSTIWGFVKKIWEHITTKLGELGRKIKAAWDFIKRGGLVSLIKNRHANDDDVEEEPYPEEDDEDDDYFKNDEDDSSNPTSSNKFAKGRGKNINRRKLKNEKSAEPDSNTTKDKIPEASEPKKTSRYKSPKIKNASRELDNDMKMLLRIATRINKDAKIYKEVLSLFNAEAKTGKRVGDDTITNRIVDESNNAIKEFNMLSVDVNDELTKFENKIANRGIIKLTSNLPGVEKYYQVIYTTIVRLQQSTGDILKQVDKKANELKHKHGNYEFNMKNSTGLNSYYAFATPKSGKYLANDIIDHTKTISSIYSRIINITSKMILSPSK